MARILIVDTMALIFRAHFAMLKRPLYTSDGQPTSAIFGVLKMLIKVLADENPEYVMLASDSPGKTWRHDIDANYKANRDEPPPDLATQIPQVIEILEAAGFPRLAQPGYEADDIIGSLCQLLSKEDHSITLLSGDKDLLQLVSDAVTIKQNKRGVTDIVTMDRDAVFDKYGVTPEQFRDYLALIGDTSDNVPGVPGIGPKRASTLLATHSSIPQILDALAKTNKKSKAEQAILDNTEQLERSKQLVSIDFAMDLDISLQNFSVDHIDFQKAAYHLQRFELTSIVGAVEPSTTDEPSQPNHHSLSDTTNYSLVQSKKDLQHLASKLSNVDTFAIDTETTGQDPWTASLLGISIAIADRHAWYIPVDHPDTECFDVETIDTVLGPILLNPDQIKITQNGKYDAIVLRRHGLILKGFTRDSMVAAYIVDPDSQQYGMDALAKRYLNYSCTAYSDLVPKGKTLRDVPIEEVTHYACEDADVTYQLYYHFTALLKDTPSLSVLQTIEEPLIPILHEMEWDGIFVSSNGIDKLSNSFSKKLLKLQSEIFSHAGLHFNLNSPTQLSNVLFEKLGLPPGKKTKTGFSTDSSTLEKLKHHSPVVQLILEYRMLAKLDSTYLKGLQTAINSETGRVHTSFNQTRAATGRLSSVSPNLQNIPIRGEHGDSLRRLFQAPKDYQLLSADYSQIELRILAHMSDDPVLIQAFRDDIDFHALTASMILEVAIDQLSSQQRSIGKTLNFSIIYGAGAYTTSERLGISVAEAKSFIESYNSRFPKVAELKERFINDAEQLGYVETLYGRRRYLGDYFSGNKQLRAQGERIAVNAPIQGSAADIIKLAMISVIKALNKSSLDVNMLLQIHDELLFEVASSHVESSFAIVTKAMELNQPLKVPLKVSCGAGQTWADAH